MAQPWLDMIEYASRKRMPPDPDQGDWQPWLQAAIDDLINDREPAPAASAFSTARRTLGTLYLPPREYRIDRPLLLRKRVPMKPLPNDPPPEPDTPVPQVFAPMTISLVGECSPLGASYARVTKIKASFNDAPALIIQGGIDVELRRLVIEGPSAPTSTLTRAFDHLQEELAGRADVYVSGAPRDNPVSPCAGVCIDPFHRSVLGADQYPRLGDEYAAAERQSDPSRNVRIADCIITGFVVGVCVSPTGQDQAQESSSAPMLMMTASQLNSHQSCLSTGTRRRILLRCNSFFGAKYGIDCVGYSGPPGARRHGTCPSVEGGNMGAIKYLLRTGVSGGHATLSGIYVESLLSLGQLGAPASATEPVDALTFNACAFTFINPQLLVYEDPDTMMMPLPQVPAMNAQLINYAQTTFNACTLVPDAPGDVSVPALPLHILNRGELTLNNCTLGPNHSRNSKDYGAQFWISGDPAQVTFTNCRVREQFYTQNDQGADVSNPVTVTLSTSNIIDSFNAQPGGGINVPYLQVPALPGSFYSFQQAADRDKLDAGVFTSNGPAFANQPVYPALRVVRGEWPLIPLLRQTLGKANLDQAALRQGRLVLPGIDPGLTLPGDVLLARLAGAAEVEDVPGVLVEPAAGAGPTLLGRIVSISGTNATVHYVPLAWTALLSSQDLTLQVYIAHFPRIHCPTRGTINQNINQIRDVKVNPSAQAADAVSLRDAWGKYQRIFNEKLKPGTYVVNIGNVFGADFIEISTRPIASSNAAERLFDADIEGVYEVDV